MLRFKVINERTKEVVSSNLAIHSARMVARKYNTMEKVDSFLVQEERRESLKDLIKKYPNDSDLGRVVRKKYSYEKD